MDDNTLIFTFVGFFFSLFLFSIYLLDRNDKQKRRKALEPKQTEEKEHSNVRIVQPQERFKYNHPLFEAALFYNEKMDSFFETASRSYVNPRLLDYLRYHNVDLAHKYALIMEEEIYQRSKTEKKPLSFYSYPDKRRILESYDDAIKATIYDFKQDFKTYSSLLRNLKYDHIRLPLQEQIDFDGLSSEEFKASISNESSIETKQLLLFLHEHQYTLLRFHKTFTDTESLDSFLNALPKDMLFSFLDALFETNKNLADSASATNEQLSTQLAGDFISAMKATKQKED